MAYYFPEGSKFYFSSTFAATTPISAATNADPSVVTSVGHGYVDNDEVLVLSGWEDANDSVFKVDQQTADTYKLLGLDTTDTTWFPALGGVGTASKISGWTEIPQILDINTSGGGSRKTPIEPLAKRNAISVPTGFDPMEITLTMGHDPANANYLIMVGLSRRLTPVAFKMVIGGGAVGYGYGYMTVSEFPSLARNQPNKVTAGIGLLGRFISY